MSVLFPSDLRLPAIDIETSSSNIDLGPLSQPLPRKTPKVSEPPAPHPSFVILRLHLFMHSAYVANLSTLIFYSKNRFHSFPYHEVQSTLPREWKHPPSNRMWSRGPLVSVVRDSVEDLRKPNSSSAPPL